MRAPYLRQIAQPLAGSVPALKSSRRWPFRADEARVLAPEPSQAVRSEPAPFGYPPSPAMVSEPMPDSFNARTSPAAASGPRQTPADIPAAMRPPESYQSEPRAAWSPGPLQPRPAEPWTAASHSSRARPLPESIATDNLPPPREIGPVAAATPTRDAMMPSPPRVIPPAVREATPERGRDLARAPREHSARASPPTTTAESLRAPVARTDRSATESLSGEPMPPRPAKPLRGPDDDRPAPGMASLSLQQPGRGLAGQTAKSDQTSEPSFKIGTVEVRVVATPPVAPPPPPARASSPGALSRGFSSPFGLRQG